MPRASLSVLIPTYNSAALLSRLLADVGWADEVVIVDSFSSDATVALGRAAGARILQHEYINSARQKNWAIPQCAGEWILLVDTDERLPPALQGEIRRLLDGGIPPGLDAYRVARQTICLGRWVRAMNLWPDYQTRLFRRAVGRYEDKEVHADVRVPGAVGTLGHPLVHHATPTLAKQIGLLDRYSRYGADELGKRGQRFGWPDLLLRPPAIFLYLYLLKGGWRLGLRGLFIAAHSAYFSFLTWCKLWEKEWRAGQRR